MNKTSVTEPAKINSFIPVTQGGILQRQCACGNHTVAGGECAECAKKKTGLQRKLTIGASNDPLEQEADRVAEQVMAMPLNSGVKHTLPRIQRFTSQASEKSLNTAPPSVDRVLASSGRPLEPTLRQDMEARFGHDFSQVRVHTGRDAEQSAKDVNAQAYTVGNDMVFGVGRFLPESQHGQRLIAHELTHVVQQQSINNPSIQRLSDPDCGSTVALPMTGSCSDFIHTCNSETFIPGSSSQISIEVEVDYAESPGNTGPEDFSVQVYKCGTLWDTKIGSKRLGPNIPSKFSFNIASVTSGDKYYLKIYSRSHLSLNASYSVTQ